jgi:hypothetical protein
MKAPEEAFARSPERMSLIRRLAGAQRQHGAVLPIPDFRIKAPFIPYLLAIVAAL